MHYKSTKVLAALYDIGGRAATIGVLSTLVRFCACHFGLIIFFHPFFSQQHDYNSDGNVHLTAIQLSQALTDGDFLPTFQLLLEACETRASDAIKFLGAAAVAISLSLKKV